ncbi:hypothetical protein H6P81_004023 [Aristolochia fimbriata]|uniref:Uncharacterized protein n=1 Tax=Aristolochia fimbriata TaxID=158543 RepID=A0AAV7FE85_ARIFI|nr:hypothetical protein H6P81_004023 [Aristolochia fimbriata]
MRSVISLDDEKEDETKSAFLWWRSAKEFDLEGHLKIDNVCNLTPRVRVLREMERLALIAPESLDELRHKLLSYRPGDFWLPAGGIKKEEVDIPAAITILLVGFSGSGKSSLVNLMYSVLGRSGLIPFAQTSPNSLGPRTMYLEEHNVLRSTRSGFCLYDSRGLDYQNKRESFAEVTDWLQDGVRHRELCSRPSDTGLEPPPPLSASRYVKRRVSCPLVVANVADIYRDLIAGDTKPLEATRELFHLPALRNCDENPILILTHGDTLSAEERLDGRVKICQLLGISETTGAYDIACITENGFLVEDLDPVTAYSATEAIYRALITSDRTHLPKKNYWDFFLLWLSVVMFAFSAFFACLSDCFSKLGSKGRNKLKK